MFISKRKFFAVWVLQATALLGFGVCVGAYMNEKNQPRRHPVLAEALSRPGIIVVSVRPPEDTQQRDEDRKTDVEIARLNTLAR